MLNLLCPLVGGQWPLKTAQDAISSYQRSNSQLLHGTEPGWEPLEQTLNYLGNLSLLVRCPQAGQTFIKWVCPERRAVVAMGVAKLVLQRATKYIDRLIPDIDLL